MTDTARAHLLGTSRETARQRRIALGLPAARKPSPEADAVVAALDLLDAASAGEIADHLGKRDRIARVNLYALLPKLAAGGRIRRTGRGAYARVVRLSPGDSVIFAQAVANAEPNAALRAAAGRRILWEDEGGCGP